MISEHLSTKCSSLVFSISSKKRGFMLQPRLARPDHSQFLQMAPTRSRTLSLMCHWCLDWRYSCLVLLRLRTLVSADTHRVPRRRMVKCSLGQRTCQAQFRARVLHRAMYQAQACLHLTGQARFVRLGPALLAVFNLASLPAVLPVDHQQLGRRLRRMLHQAPRPLLRRHLVLQQLPALHQAHCQVRFLALN